jgi:hypothetical protein
MVDIGVGVAKSKIANSFLEGKEARRKLVSRWLSAQAIPLVVKVQALYTKKKILMPH